MSNLTKKLVRRFFSEETAATTTEYAILLALIVGVCFAALGALGTQSSGTWQDCADGLEAADFGAP